MTRLLQLLLKVIITAGSSIQYCLTIFKHLYYFSCLKYAAKSSPSASSLALSGDGAALKKFLDELQPRDAQKHSRPKRSFSLFHRGSLSSSSGTPVLLSLEDALLESDEHRRTPLLFATMYGNIDCVHVLLEAASRAAEGTLKEMLAVEDDFSGLNPLDNAIYRGLEDALIAFLRAGADFWALTETEPDYAREPDSPIIYLTRRTSKNPVRYFPIYKQVLQVMAQLDPNFDINRPIYETNNPSSGQGEANEDEMHDAVSDHEGALEGEEEGEAAERPVGDGDGARPGRGINRHAALAAAFGRRRGRGGIPDPMIAHMMALRQELFEEMEAATPPKHTLLTTAAKYGGIEVLKHLLKLGARPEGDILHTCVRYLQDHKDRYALFRENLDGGTNSSNVVAGLACMKLLLEIGGADVNSRDPYSLDTPLHSAVVYECIPAVKMLLEQQPDLTLRNRDDKTALEMAREIGNEELEDLLTHQSRLSRLISPPLRSGSLKSYEDVSEDQLCPVCWLRPKVVILAPCGHKAMCKTCMRKLMALPKAQRVCPVDRTPIEGFITAVYDV